MRRMIPLLIAALLALVLAGCGSDSNPNSSSNSSNSSAPSSLPSSQTATTSNDPSTDEPSPSLGEANDPLVEILQIDKLIPSEILLHGKSLLESLTTSVRASVSCVPIIRCCAVTVHEGMVVMKVLKKRLD